MKRVKVLRLPNWFRDRYGLTSAGITIIIFLVLFALVGAANYWEKYDCERYGRMVGRETAYLNFGSCYIRNDDGNFLTTKEYRLQLLKIRIDND